jgi:hypothetical protein
MHARNEVFGSVDGNFAAGDFFSTQTHRNDDDGGDEIIAS